MIKNLKHPAPLFAALLLAVVATAAIAGPSPSGRDSVVDGLTFHNLPYSEAFALAARKSGYEPIVAAQSLAGGAAEPRLTGWFCEIAPEELLAKFASHQGRLLFLESVNGKDSAILVRTAEDSYATGRPQRFEGRTGAALASTRVEQASIEEAPLAEVIEEIARWNRVHALFNAALVEGKRASAPHFTGTIDELLETILEPNGLEADWSGGYLALRAK